MNICSTKATEILIEGFFYEYLKLDGIEDICYNGTGFIFCYFEDGRREKYKTNLTYEDALALAESVASSRQQEINASSPILSADLPNGERVQFCIPPSVDRGICAIAVRIPSKINFTLDDYVKQGVFDIVSDNAPHISNIEKELISLYKNKQYAEFLKAATKAKQTIVFAGRTGSGKTTFAKTLINDIPSDERLISIEDTKEIVFTKHQNSLNLYYPSNSDSNSNLDGNSYSYVEKIGNNENTLTNTITCPADGADTKVCATVKDKKGLESNEVCVTLRGKAQAQDNCPTELKITVNGNENFTQFDKNHANFGDYNISTN